MSDKMELPDSPEGLHAQAESITSKPALNYSHHTDLKNIIEHPKVKPETIAHIYHKALAKTPKVGSGTEGIDDDHDVMDKIVASPSTPPAVIEDYLDRTKNITDNSDVTSNHETLIDKSGIKPEVAQGLVDNYLQKGSYRAPISGNLSPDYYISKLANYDQEPSDQNKGSINKMTAAFLKSGRASPDQINKITDHIVNHYNDVESDAGHGDLSEAIHANPQFPRENLNRIFEATKAHQSNHYNYRGAESGLLNHPNIDPATVASAATDPKGIFVSEALASPYLPEETRKAIVSKIGTDKNSGSFRYSDESSLLKNPNITADEVNHIAKFHNEAFDHPLVDKQRISDWWNKSDKSTATARTALGYHSTPTDVVKDIIMKHKNMDVAAEAVKHPNVTEDLLKEASTRKAKGVQEAIAKHPIMMEKGLADSLLSGKIDPREIFYHRDMSANFQKLDPSKQKEVINGLHGRFSGHDYKELATKNKIGPEGVLATKLALSKSPHLTGDEQKRHKDDLVKAYQQEFPSDRSVHQKSRAENPLGNVVHELAKGGNKDAQIAMADSPNGRNQEDWSSPHIHADVLDHLVNKFDQQGKIPYSEQNYSGSLRPQDDDIGRFADDVLKNPNIKLDTFNKLILKHPESFEGNIKGDDENTIFDRQYGKLDDVAKRQNFISMYDQNKPGIDTALLRSKNIPLDLWQNIIKRQPDDGSVRTPGRGLTIDWDRMPADKKTAALTMPEMRKHVNSVIGSLDATKPEDWKIIQDHVINTPAGTSESDADINQISPEFFHGEKGQALAESLARTYPDKALSQIGRHIAFGVFDNTKHSYRQSHEIFGSLRNNVTPEKAKEAVGKMTEMVDKISGGDPNKAAMIWGSGLHNEELGKMLKTIGDSKNGFANGIYDHIVDKVTDPETKNLVADSLISNGLLSRAKMDQLSGDATLSQKLNRANKESIHPIIKDHFVGDQPLTDEDLQTINTHISPAILASTGDALRHYRSTSMSPEHVTELANNYQNAAKKIAANPQLDPYTVGKFMNNATQSSRFNNKLGKTIVGSMVNSIEQHVQDPDRRNQIFSSFYNQAESNTKKLLGKQFANNLSKYAIAKNDVDSVMNIIDGSDVAPSDAVKYIAKIAKDPTKMDDKALSRLLSSRKMAGSASDQLFKTGVERLTSKIQKGEEHEGFANSINRLVDHNINDKHYTEKTALSTAKTLMGLAKNPSISERMSRGVAALVNTGKISDSDTAKLFVEMPESRPNANSIVMNLNKNVANHPAVMGAALSGDKLHNLGDHLDVLNSANADTIVNRLLADPTETDKSSYLRRLSTNPSATQETFTKLARSLDSRSLNKAVGSMDVANMHLVQPVVSERLDESAKQIDNDVQSGIGINPASMDAFSANMTSTSNMIDRMMDHLEDEDHDVKNESALSDVVGSSLKSIESIRNHALKFVKDPSHKDSIQAFLNSNRTYSAAILNHKEVDLSPEHWSGLLSNISSENTFRSHGFNVNPENTAERITKWGRLANGLPTDQWKSAFDQNPSLLMRLDERSQVDSDILGAVDFEKMKQVEEEAGDSASQTISKMCTRLTEDAKAKHSSRIINTLLNDTENENDDDDMKLALSQLRGHVSPDDAKSILKKYKVHSDAGDKHYENSTKSWMARYGIGGVDFTRRMVDEVLSEPDKTSDIGHIHQLASSPHLKADHVNQIIEKIKKFKNTTDLDGVYSELSKNQDLPEGAADSLYNSAVNRRDTGLRSSSDGRDEVVQALTTNRTLSSGKAKEILKSDLKNWDGYFHHGESYPTILSNATHGGDLLRSLPTKLPEGVPNVKPENCPREVEASPKTKTRLQSLMSMLPPEGMAWKDIKRKNPQFDAYPEIKKLAIQKQNQPITPQDVADEIKKSAKGDSYHITYSSLDSSLQKHNPEANPSQLVVQLNNSKEMEEELSKDPKCWAVYQHLQQAANRTDDGKIGLHPTTPQLIGWSRVDTSDPKSWSIEEFQSDVEHYYLKSLNTIIKNGGKDLNIGNQPLSTAELQQYGDKIKKSIKNWVSGQYNAVEKLARQHGIENLFIHGTGVRAALSGYHNDGKKQLPGSLTYRYGQFPKEVGFEECDYSDYPNMNPDTHKNILNRKFDTKCWKKKLK